MPGGSGPQIGSVRRRQSNRAFMRTVGADGSSSAQRGAVWHLQVVLLVLQLRALGLQQGLQLLEVGLALHQLALPGIQPLLLLTYPPSTCLSCLQPSTKTCGLQYRTCACAQVE